MFSMKAPRCFTRMLLLVGIGLLLLSCALMAQEAPNTGVAVFVGVNQYAAPGSQLQGGGTFFKKLNSSVYFLSTFDVSAVPGTQGQLFGKLPHLQFQFRPGLAIPLVTIDKLMLMGLGEVGVASTGTDTGISTQGSFAAGGLAIYRFRPEWGLFGAMRVIRSGTTTNYVPEIGIAFGK